MHLFLYLRLLTKTNNVFFISSVSKTENKIKSTAQEIDSIRSNTEGKVDR